MCHFCQWQTVPMTDCVNDRLYQWQTVSLTDCVNHSLCQWQTVSTSDEAISVENCVWRYRWVWILHITSIILTNWTWSLLGYRHCLYVWMRHETSHVDVRYIDRASNLGAVWRSFTLKEFYGPEMHRVPFSNLGVHFLDGCMFETRPFLIRTAVHFLVQGRRVHPLSLSRRRLTFLRSVPATSAITSRQPLKIAPDKTVKYASVDKLGA